MLFGGDNDPSRRARVHVDVRINGTLADQAQQRQAFEQRCADLRSLADENQRLGILQALRQPIDVLDVVGPDFHLVPLQL